MINKSRNILFHFKGTRDYIQGPDIYNEMISEYNINDPISIKFSAHGFVDNPFCLLIEFSNKSELANTPDLKARCQFIIGKKTHYLGLIEEKPAETERYDYNEELVTQFCSVDKDEIKLDNSSPYTFVETIAAMNKFHLSTLFPDATGKWLFTRLDLNRHYDTNSNISLTFRHNMNFRLTKSDILINNEKVGEIYFSLVQS